MVTGQIFSAKTKLRGAVPIEYVYCGEITEATELLKLGGDTTYNIHLVPVGGHGSDGIMVEKEWFNQRQIVIRRFPE